MVTVVASWDARTAEARLPMSLSSDLYDSDTRLSLAEARAQQLETRWGDQPVEVVLSYRTLDEFRRTDPRFAGA